MNIRILGTARLSNLGTKLAREIFRFETYPEQNSLSYQAQYKKTLFDKTVVKHPLGFKSIQSSHSPCHPSKLRFLLSLSRSLLLHCNLDLPSEILGNTFFFEIPLSEFPKYSSKSEDGPNFFLPIFLLCSWQVQKVEQPHFFGGKAREE